MGRFRKKGAIEKDLNDVLSKLQTDIQNRFNKNDRRSYYIRAKGTQSLYRPIDTVYDEETNYLKLVLSDRDSGTRKYIKLYAWPSMDEWQILGVTSSYMESNAVKKLPKELRQLVEEYTNYYKYYGQNDPREKDIEEASNLVVIHQDENHRIVTDDVWEEMAKLADSGVDRMKWESRAVIIDGQLCVNAAAAIETLPIFEEYKESQKGNDPRKMGNLLYDACDTHKPFQGATVWYASGDEIRTATGLKK